MSMFRRAKNHGALIFYSRRNKSCQKSFGKSATLPSRQRMDSPASCATNCAVPSAEESNHSSVGTLHPHRSATCVLYARLTLSCLPLTSPVL